MFNGSESYADITLARSLCPNTWVNIVGDS